MGPQRVTVRVAVCLFLSIFVIGTGRIKAGPPPPARATTAVPGTVYFVMCVDSECWYLWPDRFSQTLGTDDFLPGGKIDQVISPSFRSLYRDSFGGTLRFSWFLATYEAYFHADPPHPGVVFDAMAPYTAEAESLGDCFGWHYHQCDWVDCDGDGKAYWNELLTFDGTAYADGVDTALAEKMLAMQMIEENFYPAVYRAGWIWENTDFPNWLERVVPFDFSNLAPFACAPAGTDRFSNVYGWSLAPAVVGVSSVAGRLPGPGADASADPALLSEHDRARLGLRSRRAGVRCRRGALCSLVSGYQPV